MEPSRERDGNEEDPKFFAFDMPKSGLAIRHLPDILKFFDNFLVNSDRAAATKIPGHDLTLGSARTRHGMLLAGPLDPVTAYLQSVSLIYSTSTPLFLGFSICGH